MHTLTVIAVRNAAVLFRLPRISCFPGTIQSRLQPYSLATHEEPVAEQPVLPTPQNHSQVSPGSRAPTDFLQFRLFYSLIFANSRRTRGAPTLVRAKTEPPNQFRGFFVRLTCIISAINPPSHTSRTSHHLTSGEQEKKRKAKPVTSMHLYSIEL